MGLLNSKYSVQFAVVVLWCTFKMASIRTYVAFQQQELATTE